MGCHWIGAVKEHQNQYGRAIFNVFTTQHLLAQKKTGVIDTIQDLL